MGELISLCVRMIQCEYSVSVIVEEECIRISPLVAPKSGTAKRIAIVCVL